MTRTPMSAPPDRRVRDVAADRFPEKPVVETARVQVLGIVKRQGKTGGEQFILTADDQHTYQTAAETYATIAKAAKASGRPIAIDYRQTPAGREIVMVHPPAEPPPELPDPRPVMRS
jgi:hypothetical protein